MLTLFRLAADAQTIADHFGAARGDDLWPGGLVAPASFAPVVTAGREFIAGPRPPGKRLDVRIVPRLWGVPPPPSAGIGGPGVLTVRNFQSPFWTGNLRNSEFRCLVPATAFMVWGMPSPKDGKRPACWFTCSDQPIFAMAGVWKDSEVPSFAVLTCEPNAALKAQGRESMPVILPPDSESWETWLHAGWDRASTLIAPYSSSLMR